MLVDLGHGGRHAGQALVVHKQVEGLRVGQAHAVSVREEIRTYTYIRVKIQPSTIESFFEKCSNPQTQQYKYITTYSGNVILVTLIHGQSTYMCISLHLVALVYKLSHIHLEKLTKCTSIFVNMHLLFIAAKDSLDCHSADGDSVINIVAMLHNHVDEA